MKHKILFLLRIFISIVFLISSIFKLFPIEAFEANIVNQGITSWDYVPFLSRFIIGLEFSIGLLLLQKKYLKMVIIPLAIALLFAFSIHLTLIVMNFPDISNCGCFGEILPMSPLSALIKNIIFIFILIYIFLNVENIAGKVNIPLALSVFPIIAIFILYPIKPYAKYNESNISAIDSSVIKKDLDTLNKNLDLTEKKQIATKDSVPESKTKKSALDEFKKQKSIFSEFTDFNTGKIDLNDGIKIVALFSLECEDCRETCKKISTLAKKGLNVPLYILFLGEETQVKDFFDYAGKTYPYIVIEPQKFFPLIKGYPPRVCFMINGNIILDWGEKDFDLNKLEQKLKNYGV